MEEGYRFKVNSALKKDDSGNVRRGKRGGVIYGIVSDCMKEEVGVWKGVCER